MEQCDVRRACFREPENEVAVQVLASTVYVSDWISMNLSTWQALLGTRPKRRRDSDATRIATDTVLT
jgi:hypothetical protein